ncbi:ABC transporter substrate-binding protein [Streptomyces sp. HNM0574]|uniref:ABC transporter substrate-binding protein n=1 Tax=Streptomyces sp. HNM0574 TaxID=2714954 RepID=UPI00146BE97D|nr:ABC transporter substrate-binding protein [Streptomyces sp. HNM0574]NLU66816.1 ABC transporter substrate-binding protein [Streptomyces sp. HNM0574]
MHSPRSTRRRRTALMAGAGALALVTTLSACGKADPYYSGSDKTVVLPTASWAGAEANTAVAKQILEKELGYRVKATQMDEPVAFDALNSGKADALMEDWRGVPKKEEKYVEEKKTVTYEGPMGVTGHIGWFVPRYYAEKHPEVLTWKGLNKLADDFKTPESGGKGQLLEGSPSYSTYDDAIIKNLGLNFKTVYAGSEAAQIKEIQKKYKAKQPFITYWWTPQWLNEQVDMVEVKLPKRTPGCDAVAEKVDCAYPHTKLAKFMNADFAKNGGDAAEFLKKFKWSTEDQTQVVRWMTIEKMDTDEAAAKWVEENKSTWSKWMPDKKK